MAQSLSDVLIHVVFSTKDRLPLIQSPIQPELYAYICTVAQNFDCPVIKINGMEDHIHILLSLARTVSISKLVADLKSNSSRWIKSKGPQFQDFTWQGGYGVFSVSRPNIDGAINYIANQKDHHKILSFKDEFLKMLQRSGIAYDEKYLWD